MYFQLVQLELNEKGQVIGRKAGQPFYELREDAMAMAEFDAARCYGDYEYDPERDCWWARDTNGRTFRFVVEQVAADGIAA
jgi:hypothetical protein